jgi:hypothetical protein
MPRYEVRLEAQDDSGHFRITRLEADGPDGARRACERLELKRVLFELSDEQKQDLCARYEVASIDELPAPAPYDSPPAEKAAFRALDTADRSRLHAHYQELPYAVVSVEEV